MSNNGRPLSPHLSIYRWPITMTTSILHRATGIALSIGFIVFSIWLFDAASGAGVVQGVQLLFGYMGRQDIADRLEFFFFLSPWQRCSTSRVGHWPRF